MLFRYIPQGAGRGEVGDGCDGLAFLFSEFTEVVGHADKGIFFHEGFPVLADESQTVHIRIYAHAQVGLFLHHGLAEVRQVGGKGFGIVGEIAGGIAVETDAFHAQPFQQTGHDDAAHAVDGVHHHREPGCLDGVHIHGGKRQDGVQVLVREIFFRDGAQIVHFGKGEIFLLRKIQDSLSFGGGKEFSLVVQEFQGIPLARVVAGGQDDAAVGLGEEDGHFRGGGGGEAALDHVYAAAHQGSYHQLFHHLTADAGVLAHHDFVAIPVRGALPLGQGRRIGGREFNDIDGGQGLARLPTDGSPDTGDGFDQCHNLIWP